MTEPTTLPFIDLQAQRARIAPAIDQAIAGVLAHGQFIMGPEIGALEAALAAFCGARHVVSCASGTDALALGLMALGMQPGDVVLTPSFTFAATAEVVVWLGGRVVFVDVQPDSFNLDPAHLPHALDAARRAGLRPVGVIAVDLFGQPADYDAIEAFCAEAGLWLIADAAQSFGADYRKRPVGSIGTLAATSFFPAKPLGCYGDGGAIFTASDALDQRLRSLRIHGQGVDKYDNVLVGMNGRLDTLQAAILLAKLQVFPWEIEQRDRIAARYGEALREVAKVPSVAPDRSSVWAQYTLQLQPGQREPLRAALAEAGIPTAVYYPKPLHRQLAYQGQILPTGGLPVTEALAERVVSLPMYPDLVPDQQDRIIDAVVRALQ